MWLISEPQPTSINNNKKEEKMFKKNNARTDNQQKPPDTSQDSVLMPALFWRWFILAVLLPKVRHACHNMSFACRTHSLTGNTTTSKGVKNNNGQEKKPIIVVSIER